MKACFQCQGKLGLAIRARNLWNGRWWWSHVYFCSARCEDRNELERSEANANSLAQFLCSRLALTFDACGLDRKSMPKSSLRSEARTCRT